MTDLTADACRRLWASVILAALADWNAAHVKARREKNPRPTPEQVETAARLWIRSSWGRQIAAMAGIELDPGRAVELIRLSRVEFKARMVLAITATEEAA